MPVQKTCEVCESSFLVPPCRTKSAKACSHACAVQVRAKSKERQVEVACKECGVAFTEAQCHAGRRVYCSKDCREKSTKTVARKSGFTGDKNPAWVGGITKHSDGYIYQECGGHPFTSNGKYVFQHRLVAESHLRHQNPSHHFLIEVDGQKYIRQQLDVHHINEDKSDNDPSNLVVCTRLAHNMFHRGLLPQQSEFWLAAPI